MPVLPHWLSGREGTGDSGWEKRGRPCPREQVHTDAGEPEEVVRAEEEEAAEAAKARDGRKGDRQSGRGKRG